MLSGGKTGIWAGGRGVARQERPVDPAAGPLQSFAYDLRKVRAEVGNPTYRVLAKTAGYSATTLSEAAGGLRKPTLDVVLAYVGACQGDVDAWRRRWYELDAELRSEPETRDEPELETAEPPTPPTPQPETVASKQVWWRRRGTQVAAGVGAMALVGIGLAQWPFRAEPAGAQPCPKGAAHPAFTGITYGAGAHVRRGANRDNPVLYTIPSGCKVGFAGFCVGEKVHDTTGGTPDIRWFRLEDGNVVSSAVVHGNPGPKVRPSRCRDDRPVPQSVTLAAAPDTGKPPNLKLDAAGSDVDIVGFTASYPFEPGGSPTRWHQIAFTEAAGPGAGFHTTWKVEKPGQGQVIVAAAVCLGGDGPTTVAAVRTVQMNNLTVLPQPAALNAQEMDAAAKSACQYPS
jgi:hypothetical protein